MFDQSLLEAELHFAEILASADSSGWAQSPFTPAGNLSLGLVHCLLSQRGLSEPLCRIHISPMAKLKSLLKPELSQGCPHFLLMQTPAFTARCQQPCLSSAKGRTAQTPGWDCPSLSCSGSSHLADTEGINLICPNHQSSSPALDGHRTLQRFPEY